MRFFVIVDPSLKLIEENVHHIYHPLHHVDVPFEEEHVFNIRNLVNAHHPTRQRHVDIPFAEEHRRSCNLENAHHPEHHVDVEPPDKSKEGPKEEEEQIIVASDKDEEKEEFQRVSAWIYPEAHQEIYTGRPTDVLGGGSYPFLEPKCRSPVTKTSTPRKVNEKKTVYTSNASEKQEERVSAWTYPKKHQELDDWRPTEWLVGGRMTKEAPPSPVRDHLSQRPAKGSSYNHYMEALFADHSQTQSSHPQPIKIEGHPVQNSPFRQKKRVLDWLGTVYHPGNVPVRPPIKLAGHPVHDSPFLAH